MAARLDDSGCVHLASALRHLRRVDPALREVIGRHPAPTVRRSRNVFRSLCRAVIGQQLSGAAAEAIYRRFLAQFDGRGFPTPAAVLGATHEELRAAGLSGAKARTVHDLAAKLEDGTVPRRRLGRMSDDGLREVLTQVKGIGPWSVDMFLIFALWRADVLPVGDLGVRKGVQRHFGLDELPDAEAMRELAEPWAPYRTVASWYMWRVLEE